MSTATQRIEQEGPVAPYHDKEAWLEVHRTGLGGSDAAAVLGFDPYRNRADVYDAKMGLSEGPDPAENADLRRGIKQEPLAADRYREVTGRKIRRQPLRRHPEYEWMICDIDRQVVGLEDGPMLLELKVPRTANFFAIRDRGLPEHYIIQLHHNMVTWGYEMSSFGVYTPEYDDLIYFDVALDPELARWLLQEEERFWREHIEAGIRPGSEKPTEHPPLPDVPGEATIRQDGAWLDAAREYRRTEALLEGAKADHADAKERLLALASDDEDEPLHVEGGGVRVKRSWSKGRRSFQKERLLDEHPDIDLDRYYERGEPYTRTRIKVTLPAEVEDLEEVAR